MLESRIQAVGRPVRQHDSAEPGRDLGYLRVIGDNEHRRDTGGRGRSRDSVGDHGERELGPELTC